MSDDREPTKQEPANDGEGIMLGCLTNAVLALVATFITGYDSPGWIAYLIVFSTTWTWPARHLLRKHGKENLAAGIVIAYGVTLLLTGMCGVWLAGTTT